ncbi:MAG: MBL fold metallo-hydrolase [Gammaproteobacteria bacterium]
MRSRAQVGGLLFATCLLLSSTRAVADAAESAAQAPSLTVVTLGTGGGPAYRDKRAMSSNAVLFGKDVHIVDAGEGLLHRLAAAGLQVDQVQSVFITHHHFDHNADLGPLIGFRWLARQYAPLPVIGPPMTKQMVEDQARAYRPIELAPITIGGPAAPPIATTVAARDLPAELYEPAVIWRQGALTVTAVLNDHYHFEEGSEAAKLSRSYAMRFETPSRTVVFTGDTGPSRRVEALAHLAEDHLSPEEVGKLAARAGVKRVVQASRARLGRGDGSRHLQPRRRAAFRRPRARGKRPRPFLSRRLPAPPADPSIAPERQYRRRQT